MSTQPAAWNSRVDVRWERTSGASIHAWFRCLVFLILLSTTGVLLLYVGHFFKPDFSSDDAVLNLLAEAMHAQGRLFPHGWVTNNGDLMVPSGALLIAPLLTWWPNGFAVHAVASVVLSLMLLGIVAWFLRVARISWLAVAITLTVLASGFTIYFTAMVFAQTTYFWWPAGFIAGAALLTRHHLSRAAADGGRSQWPLVALFVLVASVAFANPGRVGVMMLLPLYAFDRTLAWSTAAPPGGLRSALMRLLPFATAPIVLIAAWMVAFVVYRLLMNAEIVATRHSVSQLRLTDWPGFADHVRIFANGWFDYLGGSSYGVNQKPWEPFMRTFRTSLAVAITAVAVVELRDLRRQHDPVCRALFFAFLAALLPVLALFLAFEPLAQDSSISLRYFSVAYFILLLLCAWTIERWLRNASRLTTGLLAAGCVMLAVSAVHRMIPFGETFWMTRTSMTMHLSRILQREGLTWGYATWWNAGATTVLSEGAVRVHPVEMYSQTVRPHPAMVDRHWYAPSAHRGRTFLAMRSAEATPAQRAHLEARFGPPEAVIEESDYRIQIYPRNIAADLSCAEAVVTIDTPLTEQEFDRLRILSAEPFETRPGVTGLRVRIRNDTARTIASAGAHPVTIGVHLHDAQGAMVSYDWLHAPLDCALTAGEERVLLVHLPEAPHGSYRMTVDLVQEGIAWFADKGADTITLPLETP
ncbi:MAG TPA: hypothetical protein VMR06_12640 [Dokdonella sp.]|uniref:hypothetical protein n=1 Tax=Dokdonella sp. TaxID=2291710 RepID=UPI002BDF7418|nr:hypothetical protein [Dokdonella sp.]HUD42830.1 hypothetical protein [Dokdonella sp.]